MQYWVILSLTVMVMIVAMDVFLYRRWIALKYTPLEITVYPIAIAVVVAGMYTAVIGLPKQWRGIDKSHVGLWLVTGIMFFASFLVIRTAQAAVPNMGYVSIFLNASAVGVMLLLAVMYKDELSFQALTGVLLTVIGTSMIALA